jgi:glutaconate CoA-transferase subunit B
VVTDLAVLSVDKTDGRLKVNKLMPGVTFEKVKESTEFKVEAASSVAQVPAPAADELRILRDEVDPGREYLGKGD